MQRATHRIHRPKSESFSHGASPRTLFIHFIIFYAAADAEERTKNRKTKVLFLNYSFEYKVGMPTFKIYSQSLTLCVFYFFRCCCSACFSISFVVSAAEAVYFTPTSPNISINFYAFDAPHSFAAGRLIGFAALSPRYQWMG